MGFDHLYLALPSTAIENLFVCSVMYFYGFIFVNFKIAKATVFLVQSYAKLKQLWLGGSVGWSVVLYTERLRVPFPISPHTWAVGSIPSRAVYGKQLINVSLSHRCFSLYLFLSLSNQ